MSDLSELLNTTPARTAPANELGQVVADLGQGVFLVQSNGTGLTCLHAASCVLLPEAGDQVLLAHVAGNVRQSWIVAVLVRAGRGPAQWRVDGDLVIASTQGAVSVQAGSALNLQSDALNVQADTGQIAVAQMRVSGTLWQGTLGTVRLLGQVCETLVDRIMQISKISLRRVEQIDHVRAAQLDYEGSARVRIRSKYTAVTAKNVLKAKGRQVHIG